MARMFAVFLMTFAELSVRLLEGVGYVWRVQAEEYFLSGIQVFDQDGVA